MTITSLARREFILIRHGESVSNANLITDYPENVGLTPRGHQQAQAKAATWALRPDIFVVSKYLRTQKTAEPFLQKFPGVPVEEWDIHEFTYLDREKYRGTTFEERHPHSQLYWAKRNPHHKDADVGESFAEFVARCHATLERMKTSPHACSVIFCHSYFIKGLILAATGRFNDVTAATMIEFLNFHEKFPLDNCDEVRCSIDNDILTFDSVDTLGNRPRKVARSD